MRITDDDGNSEVYELLNDGWVNRVGSPATAEEVAKYDDATWVVVGVPEGTSSQDFDDLVRNNAQSIGAMRNGRSYDPTGYANSNRYVFDVITKSGGQVPYRALLGWKFAPGFCGGNGLRIGTRCQR